MEAYVRSLLGDEFSIGDVDLNSTPKEIIKKFSEENPEAAESIYGGKDEIQKVLNSDFAIDTSRSSVSLVNDSDFIPLDWEKPLNQQGGKINEILKNINELILSVSVAMPNAGV